MTRGILALWIVLLGLVAARGQERPPPPHERIRADVAALASQVLADEGAGTAYVGTSSSLNFIRGHAWILTLWVADAPEYRAQYFVLSEIDGRLVGEAMRAAGPEGVERLQGAALQRFLARVRLDGGPVRGLYERFYRRKRR